MPIGFFSQLMLFILSVMIILTYVKPSLGEMKSVQDKIASYKEERQKVSAVNATLDDLKARMTGVSAEDNKRLLTYMPNTVDILAVPRDIKAITDEAGVIVKDIKYSGAEQAPVGEAPVASDQLEPQAHSFSVTLEGSYAQLKQVFTSFEQNAYPLEVQKLTIIRQKGGFLQALVDVKTYNRRLPSDEVAEVAVQ